MGDTKDYVTQTDELGSINISEDVLAVITAAAALEVEGVSGLAGGSRDLAELLGGKKNLTRGVRVQMLEEGVTVELAVMVKFGYTIMEVAQAVQDAVATNIESMSGLKVHNVNITVGGVTFDKEPPKVEE